jgi:hypothetical protein
MGRLRSALRIIAGALAFIGAIILAWLFGKRFLVKLNPELDPRISDRFYPVPNDPHSIIVVPSVGKATGQEITVPLPTTSEGRKVTAEEVQAVKVTDLGADVKVAHPLRRRKDK